MAINVYAVQREAGALFDKQNPRPEKPDYAKQSIITEAPTLIEHREGGVWVQVSRNACDLRGVIHDKAFSINLDLERLRQLEAEVKRCIATLGRIAEHDAKVKAANEQYNLEFETWSSSRNAFIDMQVETAKQEAKREARREALANKKAQKDATENATETAE